MTETLHRIPGANDLNDLREMLQDFFLNQSKKFVIRLQPAPGSDKIDIVVNDSLDGTNVPTLREFDPTQSEVARAEKFAAIEDTEKLVLRTYSNILLGGIEKVVALFDPAPAENSLNPAGDGITPAADPSFKAPIGAITIDHWLNSAKREPLGQGSEFQPRFLVIHYTEGWAAESSIDYWRTENNGILAHVVVDRDGQIFQCRPFNQTCQHAGSSRLREPQTDKLYEGLNSSSIGIEIANTGDGGDDHLHTSLNKHFPAAELITAHHRNAGIKGSNAADRDRTKWEAYPKAQLESVFGLVQLLMAKYQLTDITGHDCIAFERKTDPGPAFPMEKLREENGLKGLPPVWDKAGAVLPV